MKQKDNYRLINYFLKTQEPVYMPNFLFTKSKKNIKINANNNINNKSLNNNNNTIYKSRNDAFDTINSFSNTQYDKSKYLTPFQKLLKYKEDIKNFNSNKVKQSLYENKIEIIPTIKTERKNKKRILIHSKNQMNNSPKEYLNKIKLYKINSYGYNSIKNDLYNFDINLNTKKINNNNEAFYTLGIKEKKIPIKKLNIDENILKEKINKNDNSKNDLNIYINNELLLQLNKDFNNKKKLLKIKKAIKKHFFKDNYEQLLHNIETDSINSPKSYTKRESRDIKSKKIKSYSNNVKYLLCFSRSRKNNKNKENNSLNNNTTLNTKNSNNNIREIKNKSNISSLFFFPEHTNNSKTQQSRNHRLTNENNTNY